MAEFAAFEQGGIVHEAFEVVGDAFLADGAVHPFDDEVGGFGPAEVAEHHFTGEDERAGVDLVFAGIFGGGSVGGFEDGDAGLVVDVGAGGDADAADTGGEGVGDVVPVEVERGDYVVFSRSGENLLEHGVGDDVFDDDLLAGFGVFDDVPGAAVEGGGAEVLDGDFVAPVAEGAFGEFHDVAFVDEGDGVAVVVDRVLNGGFYEAVSAFLRYGFDADAGGFGKADFGDAHVALKEVDDLFDFVGAFLIFDAGVDVF